MPDPLDLTPFGFTPTESRMYATLVGHGPGTGYALAQAAGLARANAYAALEGLVSKGAARVDGERPKRYRPESATALLARLTDRQAGALDALAEALGALGAPNGPALVELTSARACWQVLARDLARASRRVWLLAPPDAYAALGPVLRRVAADVGDVTLLATAPVRPELAAARVVEVTSWPGEPVLALVDDRAAVLGSRTGERFAGHWGAEPAFVAGAELALERIRTLP